VNYYWEVTLLYQFEQGNTNTVRLVPVKRKSMWSVKKTYYTHIQVMIYHWCIIRNPIGWLLLLIFRSALHCGFSCITDIQCLIYMLTRARALRKTTVMCRITNNNIFAKLFIIFIQPCCLEYQWQNASMRITNKRVVYSSPTLHDINFWICHHYSSIFYLSKQQSMRYVFSQHKSTY
jgi:hypothetical protein